ncbi:MAG: tetratricopeptide repeat protein [Terrimicrobiaceae bacterium]
MQPVPRIFVSATSRDLRTARGLVSEGLRRMECLPIVQDDFPPDYKSVRDMLRTKIETCDAVVHLAGFYYGAEPQPVLPGPDRRSFTQMEYEIAMELKKPCYVFLCAKDFPFDKHDPEPEDKQQLQLDHRARLLQRDELFYEFATPEELSSRTRELQLSVENLREELAKERGRRRITLIVAIAAVVIAVGGGLVLMGRQGEQAKVLAATNDKLERQGLLIEQLLAEQTRLRKAGGSDMRQIAMQAEQNVAAANKQPVEEVRNTVLEAIAEAGQAVADARAGKGGMAAALRRAAEKSAKGKVDTGANRDLAAALQRLAGAQMAAGHVNESIDAQTERLALLDRSKDPEVWAAAANNLAMAIYDRDVMSAEPAAILTEAVEWAKSNPDLGPKSPHTLMLMTSLARVVPREEGRSINRKVLAILEGTKGAKDPATVEATLALARSLVSGDDKEKAESLALFRRVVKVNEDVAGPEAPATLSSELDLAYALGSQKKFAEAEALYRKVLKAREKSLGPDHEDTLNPLLGLVFLREDQNDYPEAIELARRALASSEKALGPDAPPTLVNATILAGILTRSDSPANLDEAETLTRRVLEARIRTIGAAQPDTLQSFETLGDILEAKGDAAGAKALILERLEEQGKAVGIDDTGYAFTLFIEASRFFIADDNETALDLAQRCLAIRDAQLGPDDLQSIETRNLLSSIYMSLGSPEEAGSLARRNVEIVESEHSDNTTELAKAYSKLAGVLAQSQRSAEALIYARKAAKTADESMPEQERAAIDAKLAALQEVVLDPESFASLRKDWKAKSDDGSWKKLRKDLPGHGTNRSHYCLGWFDGDRLMRVMQVDSTGEGEGTFTFYHWTPKGSLRSVLEVREGLATQIKNADTVVDVFNFMNDELVGWTQTIDDEKETMDPAAPEFYETGKRVTKESAEAAGLFD